MLNQFNRILNSAASTFPGAVAAGLW